jgi:hypothetical protein
VVAIVGRRWLPWNDSGYQGTRRKLMVSGQKCIVTVALLTEGPHKVGPEGIYGCEKPTPSLSLLYFLCGASPCPI